MGEAAGGAGEAAGAEAGPLLLITRPEAAARRFLASCEAAWGGSIPSVVSPLQEIRPVEPPPEPWPGPGPAALILTSEAGAARAGALSGRLGLAGLPAWCVGPRTAAAAAAWGFRAREAGPDADGLVATIMADPPRGPLLHLRGTHAAGRVVERLRAAGIAAREVVAYAQVPRPLGAAATRALAGRCPVVAPIFSPRSAQLLARAVAERSSDGPAPLHVVALSPAVARAWQDGPARSGLGSVEVAARPDGDATRRATLACLHRLGLVPPGTSGAPAGSEASTRPRLEGDDGAV